MKQDTTSIASGAKTPCLWMYDGWRRSALFRRMAAAVLLAAAAGAPGTVVAYPDPPVKPPTTEPVPPAEAKPAEKPPEEIVILEGQVTDGMGIGMTGVEVVVRRKADDGGEGELVATATTNETGDYQIKSKAKLKAKVVVTMKKADFAPIVHEVTLGENEWPEFLADELLGNLKIAGKVVDAVAKTPVAKASIDFKAAYRDWYATSGEDGAFELTGLPPGKGALIVQAERYGRETVPVPEIASPGEIVVALKPERVVTMIVLDDQDKPIKGVSIETYDQQREDFRMAVTDDAGRSVLRGLHFDTTDLQMRLTHDEHVGSGAFDDELSLPTDKPESEHKLFMRRAGRIAGEILDAATGRPLNGARVLLGEDLSDLAPRSFTNDDGKYLLKGAPSGTCVITVHCSGYAPETAEVRVAVGETASNSFKLSKGVLLKGVVKTEGGDPIKGAYIETGAWRGRQTLGLRAITDDQGRFEIDDAPPDEFELVAMRGRSGVVKKKVTPGTSATVEFLMPAAAADDGPTPLATVKVGDAAPDFMLTGPAGESIKLADLKGKTVLMTFWATWCPPCVAEVPIVVAAYEKLGSRKDVVFLNLSLDMDKKAAQDCIAKKKMVWLQAIGVEGGATKAADAYGVHAIPTNFVIGSDGKILARDLHGTAIEARLRELLGKEGGK